MFVKTVCSKVVYMKFRGKIKAEFHGKRNSLKLHFERYERDVPARGIQAQEVYTLMWVYPG